MRSLSHRPLAAFRLLLAPLALAILAGPAVADSVSRLDAVGGHLSVGYAKLFIGHAPGGSISLSGGLEIPVATGWRAGADVGYHLLGNRNVERGSLSATVDYSVLEFIAFAHWQPPHLGPIGRISFGPSLVSAHAELSSSGGGAGFSDLAVGEVAPGAALQVTVIRPGVSPVRLGFELGAHLGFLVDETWSLGTARVTVHY